MAEDWASDPAPQALANTGEFLSTFAIVLACIALMLVVDVWLARIDARESRLHAVHLYNDGEALLVSGHPADAADQFASAQALDRSNARYGVALAEALLADGRVDDAETELRSVLGRAETDGAANLVMARILTREHRIPDAVAFYHRAIYGNWPATSSERPLDARLELIDLLVRRGAKQDVLAELLPLQEVDPDSVALRRRLGHLLVTAGSPERAVPIFRDLLKRNTNDGDAYAGIGEASLLLGNFATARADLVQATRLLPDSTRYASVMQVADTVLALDPLARGIGHSARYQRGRAVLQLTIDAMTACGGSSNVQPLVDSARVLLSSEPRSVAGRDVEEADPVLDLANELWSKRPPQCGAGGNATMQALALVQKKLS
jgi:Flp pilus assembly protein TadD